MAIPGVANVAIWGQRDTAVPGARRSRPAARQRRDARRGRRGRRPTPSAVARGRVRRHAEPAARRPPPLADRRRPTTWPGRSSRSATARRCAWATWPTSTIGSPPPIGDAVINDGPGLLLIVEKQPTGNTLEVTRNVEKALDALEPGLKGVDIDPTIFRPATFIERSLDNLTRRCSSAACWSSSSWSRSCSTGGRRSSA